MANRTEYADAILVFIIVVILTAVFYFLACLFFLDGALAFGGIMLTAASIGTIFTIFGIREILVRRWAEQRMREMEKEKEKNQ